MDFSFSRQLEELLRTQKAVGKTGKVFDLGAVSTANNLQVIRALMLAEKPVRTLEIGLAVGGSVLTFAASHRDLGHQPARQHMAIDPFQESVWDSAAVLAIERDGLADFVDFRLQYSSVVLAELFRDHRLIDLIYVDGSHTFEDVFVDAYFGFLCVSHGGIVVFDDCTITAVARVLSFVRANWGSWIEELDLSQYHPSGDSIRYRAGRRLGRVQLRAFRRIGDDLRRGAAAELRRF